MDSERIKNYNDHATFLCDIAKAVLEGNKNVLDVNEVKEIIALYLMVPYFTESTLMTPDPLCCVPKVTGEFVEGIQYKDLRNTICHSFVTVEEDDGCGIHGQDLIFDDRIIKEQKVHSQKGYHGEAYRINISTVHEKLLGVLQTIASS